MNRAGSGEALPGAATARMAMQLAGELCRAARLPILGTFCAFAFNLPAWPQLEESAARVYSDTIARRAPQPPAVFTDTPARPTEGGEKQALPHPASASDDFDNNTPTAWWFYTGVTASQVSGYIQQYDARLIDIQVDSASPLLFTVTMVKNTGAYAKSWWWYYGETAAQVGSLLSQNGARPISIKAYVNSSHQLRFAVVMIKNTGADDRAWAWYYGQQGSDLAGLAGTPHMRFIALDSYNDTSGNMRYTVILDGDTGANSVPGWYYYFNTSLDTIAGRVNDGNRVIYFNGVGNGNYNAVLESCANGCSEWWWWVGFENDPSGVVQTAFQDGARPINVSRFACGTGTCYASAMINNANEITTRVGNILRQGGVSGVEGLYLKQVSGPTPGVLAGLEDSTVYEPASSIKVLANLYAMTQVQAGAIKLTTQIPHNTDKPDSCPSQSDFTGTEPLGTALREMMWHSDNARTLEVTDKFTDAKINAYAQKIGMTNTEIDQIIGCGFPPDKLTLDDAATLYAGVANQDLLSAKDRGIFYSDMAGRAQYESEGYDWTGIWTNDIPNIINQVAPAGTTAAQKAAYQNEMNLAYKAGNYLFCQNDSCSNVTEDYAISGWFQIPFCKVSGTTYAEYVWGVFVSNEPTSGYTQGTTVTQAYTNFFAADAEPMREQIAAGMASCVGKSFEVMAYSPADLSWSNVNVGTTTSSKTITVTNNQPSTVTGLSISIFGDFMIENSTCGARLAPGKSCTISVDFRPTTTGERTGAVIISDDGIGQPQTIELTGNLPSPT